ncbi:type 1 fimbrial protein [Enterobacter cloacae complex sp. P6RS]|uniref:fimbrial protein n=1 Tax=unclassified Enterobacter cloacae complex TaxID=2757714 RepID=UPI0018747B00|nr:MULTISPECIES: fimbrial protein [unclassified Enterobacter cloacae complex]MBE4916787.1 type 1 fimbrial protein [Enterobacter cloacae complex sp. P4RS]MBE4990678.1 type 1 fimbrial protein [Enterobacter cloacae complex sp. P6RS]
MYRKRYSVVFIFLTLPLMGRADSNINISGQVIASPCVVDTGTVSKMVNLGEATKQNLINAGDGAVWSDFELLVQNCPAGTSSVTAKFTGNADTQDPTAWKNSGTSNNVALRIASRDHATAYSVNSTMQVNVDSSTRSSTFPLSARMFTPQGNSTAGTFQAVMNVDFTYQ